MSECKCSVEHPGMTCKEADQLIVELLRKVASGEARAAQEDWKGGMIAAGSPTEFHAAMGWIKALIAKCEAFDLARAAQAPAERCPACGHRAHEPGKCLNSESDNDCSCYVKAAASRAPLSEPRESYAELSCGCVWDGQQCRATPKHANPLKAASAEAAPLPALVECHWPDGPCWLHLPRIPFCRWCVNCQKAYDKQHDWEWALHRVRRMQEMAETNAGRLGTKLLRGHGYPDEVMSDAQDALALRIMLSALRVAAPDERK